MVLVADQPMVMVARKDLPVDSLPAFIHYAKTNQGKMQFGSAGAGSTGHLDCALFNAAIGVNITHIPYKGGGPAMQDLIGGRIDYFCTLTGTAVPHIEGGSVKAIGVFTRERAPMLPKVPSSFEQGFTAFEASTWFALLPAGRHAGADRPAAARSHHRGDGHACDADPAARRRRHRGRAGAPQRGVSQALRRDRDREERRAAQGGRHRDGLTGGRAAMRTPRAARPDPIVGGDGIDRVGRDARAAKRRAIDADEQETSIRAAPCSKRLGQARPSEDGVGGVAARDDDRHGEVSPRDRAMTDLWLPLPCRTMVQPAAQQVA